MNIRSFPALLLFLFCLPAFAENWPGWRGPRGDGSSLEKNLPQHWNGPQGENIAWKAEIPGKGHASPIVWDDRVFVVSCREESEDRLLICLDRASGRIALAAGRAARPPGAEEHAQLLRLQHAGQRRQAGLRDVLRERPGGAGEYRRRQVRQPARLARLDGRGRLRFRRQPPLAGPARAYSTAPTASAARRCCSKTW